MKNIVYILIVVSVYSCGSLKIEQADIVGEYYKTQASGKALSISYDLTLNSDNTFSLSMKMQDANPKCNGRWEIKDNYIYLKCEESEDIVEILSSGHMKEKDHKLEVMSRNKIKFKDVILKKQ